MSMQRKFWVLLIIALLPLKLMASPTKDLEKAAKKVQVAFVLVTDKGAGDVEKARDTIKDAVKQVKKAVMLQLDRGNADNADLVKQFSLFSAPTPLIIAIHPNGTVIGAIPVEKATSELLVKMVPSPKKAELIKALTDGNAVLITVSSKDMKSSGAVSDSCASACQKAVGKTVCIAVDMNDEQERAFLTELKVDTSATEPMTIVANPKGQIAGKFNGPVKVDDLVQATTKKIGGCCPPKVTGGTSSCAPATK
jgi:hypothetical protein